jgi:hypothetical protein
LAKKLHSSLEESKKRGLSLVFWVHYKKLLIYIDPVTKQASLLKLTLGDKKQIKPLRKYLDMMFLMVWKLVLIQFPKMKLMLL